MEGSIPFQENLSMDAIEDSDTVRIKTQIEDLSIGIINSRKLSIRALVEMKALAETIMDEAITYDIEEEENVEKKLEDDKDLNSIQSENNDVE